MPHELKLEGSPGCPHITPLAVGDNQFAVVENISDVSLGFRMHLNQDQDELIPAGTAHTFTASGYLVATGSTDIRLTFGNLDAPLTVADAVEPEAAPEAPADPAPEAPVEPVEAPVEAPAPEPTPEPEPAPSEPVTVPEPAVDSPAAPVPAPEPEATPAPAEPDPAPTEGATDAAN